MVGDVAEIVLHARADDRDVATREISDGFEQGIDCVLDDHQPLLECIELLDVLARRGVREDALLEHLELIFEMLEHREVAVDHRVHQRIEHIARAMSKQVRFTLSPCAHFLEAAVCARAY